VTAVHPETSTAVVRLAVDSIERGDLVLPRKPRPPEIVLKSAPPGIEGQIVFVAQQRIYTGNADRVFLNRGALHGLEVGTELDVFDSGDLHPDRVRRSEVMTPDESAGRLVVIDVDPETATALVVVSERELTIGDHFRGHSPAVASR
jgi:hypothetical protein